MVIICVCVAGCRRMQLLSWAGAAGKSQLKISLVFHTLFHFLCLVKGKGHGNSSSGSWKRPPWSKWCVPRAAYRLFSTLQNNICFFSLSPSLSSLHAIKTVFRVCVQLVFLCEFLRLHCANRTGRVDAENCARENVSAKGTNVIEREIITACIYFPLAGC